MWVSPQCLNPALSYLPWNRILLHCWYCEGFTGKDALFFSSIAKIGFTSFFYVSGNLFFVKCTMLTLFHNGEINWSYVVSCMHYVVWGLHETEKHTCFTVCISEGILLVLILHIFNFKKSKSGEFWVACLIQEFYYILHKSLRC